MSCTRTDLVYVTRSDSARDNLMVFLFLKGALLISNISITTGFTGNMIPLLVLLGMVNNFRPLPAAAVV